MFGPRSLLWLILSAALALSFGVAFAQSGPDIDECTSALYLDRTAPGADRSLNWDYSFAADPERCIIVRVGQTVVWNGSFVAHPLEQDDGDRPNPIETHNNGVVTFTTPGTFGFRCVYHFEMHGAIRVLPAPTLAPWAPRFVSGALSLLLLGAGAFAAWRFGATGADARRTRLEVLALLVISGALAYLLGPARYGSPDGATYLSAALHLLNGDGYVTSVLDERGQFARLSVFAPLFSLLVAAIVKLTGAQPLSALEHVVAGSFMLYALACYALVRTLSVGRLRRWTFVFALALVCAPGSVLCLRGALSDLLGAALVLLASAHLLRSDERVPTLASGALFALALWARWSNLYFVLSAVLGLVLVVRSLPLRERLWRALAFATAVGVLVGPLWLRNLRETGAAMGERASLPSDPLAHVQHALLGITHGWFGPLPRSLLSNVCRLLLVVVAAGIAHLWFVQRDPRLKLGLVLAGGYTLAVIASRSATPFDALDHPRFWLPVVPLLLALSLRAFAAARPSRSARLLACGALVAFALAALRSGVELAQLASEAAPRSGLFAERFAASLVVKRALALSDAGDCVLSAPHAFWLYPQIGTRPVGWLSEDEPTLPRGARPSCVLILREQVEFNTEAALFHDRLAALSATKRAELVTCDGLAELWWTDGSGGPLLTERPLALDAHAQHAHHAH